MSSLYIIWLYQLISIRIDMTYTAKKIEYVTETLL